MLFISQCRNIKEPNNPKILKPKHKRFPNILHETNYIYQIVGKFKIQFPYYYISYNIVNINYSKALGFYYPIPIGLYYLIFIMQNLKILLSNHRRIILFNDFITIHINRIIYTKICFWCNIPSNIFTF